MTTRFILLCTLFCTGLISTAGEKNALEEFTKAVPVEFIETYDPGYIRLKYKGGDEINAIYIGVDYQLLWKWQEEVEKTKKNRPMTLRYTLKDGVVVTDNNTGKSFQLPGVIDNHPIDYAIDAYQGKDGSTLGMMVSYSEGEKAWDAELNRIYQALGGSMNVTLREAQRAWIKYRDAQIKLIHQQYAKREGTIWGVVYASRVMTITKDQAVRLQSLRNW